ncbi:hypothetical protein [Marinobacter sp.]|uniref:hypothetical protein n=1 Tax=Marinobacter sp. TaxID=50741 RepID=UPI00384C1A75
MPKTNHTPVMLINPEAHTADLANESDLRLDAVKELLQGLGAANKDGVVVEDLQAACSVAGFLVDDARRLQEEAFRRAKREG